MKSEREAERRKIRYKEKHQREKREINDSTSSTADTAVGEAISDRRAESILPPSKPRTGRRLSAARDREARARREMKGGALDSNGRSARKEAIFTKGPEAHRIASLP